MKKHLLILAVALVAFVAGCVTVPSMQEKARAELFTLMRTTEAWTQIHAAEELCHAGILSNEITEIYEKAYAASEPRTPYRIGCIRVLYRNCPEKRNALREELLSNAFDPKSAAAGHAVETIGKLGLQLSPAELAQLKPYIGQKNPLDEYGIMAFVLAGDAEGVAEWKKRLEAGNSFAAALGTYVDELPEYCHDVLETAWRLPGTSEAFQMASFQSYLRNCDITNADHAELWKRVETCSDGIRRFYLQAVGDIGDENDAKRLMKYLKDKDPEICIAAAGSVIRIANRCDIIGVTQK